MKLILNLVRIVKFRSETFTAVKILYVFSDSM
jgi:hypothetical protein